MSYLLSTEALIDTISEVPDIAAVADSLDADEIAISVMSFAQLRTRAHALTDPAAQASWLEAIQQHEDQCEHNDRYRDVDIEVAREYALIAKATLNDANGKNVSVEDRIVIATAMTKSLVLICRRHPWADELTERGLQVKNY